MIVVLDTNAFVYDTHLLGKEIGQHFLNLLRSKKGQIFIPEILRIEYLEQSRIAANGYQKKLADRAGDIRSLLGHDINYDVLSDATIDQATEGRLRTLDPVTRLGPTVDELSVATGRRVIARKPPGSKTDHGYKDCMIWEATLTLPAGSDVRLISHDHGFYDDDGFSRVLAQEAQIQGIRIRGYKRLEHLVQELRADTPELDLAAADVAEKIQNPTEIQAVELVLPAESELPRDTTTRPAGQEVENALGRVQTAFQGTDGKVLGFIAYLEMGGKAQIFGLLSQAGIAVDIASNAAERLALAGIIRDTGNHYVLHDRALALAASATVEEEIINLLGDGA